MAAFWSRGGHLNDGNGSDQASIYDYRTNTWTPLPKMNNGRWYPTATALPDGRILVISGSFRQMNNAISQIWDGTAFKEIVSFFGLPLYPRMHIASDGRVFMAGSNVQTYLLNIGTNSWAAVPAPGGLRRNGERQYAPSVMYDVDKVIYIGGGNDPGTNAPTAQAETIDLERCCAGMAEHSADTLRTTPSQCDAAAGRDHPRHGRDDGGRFQRPDNRKARPRG